MGADLAPQETLTRWIEHLKQQGKSHHTLAAYRRAVEHFAAWNEATYHTALEPGAILPRDVRDWKAWQQSVEKAAPATVNQRLVGLSRFFIWAVSQGIATEDPTARISALRLPSRQPRGIPAAHLRRMLRKAKGDPRDYAILEVLAGTGLRVGDVVMGERSGKVIVRQGKHGGYREVPLTADVRQALAAYLATHPQKDNPDAPLWMGTRGALAHRSSVMHILDTYARQVRISQVSPHALRHTFATRYLKANPDDLRGLARLLGHASLNTVMLYTEPGMDDLAERMERMEQGGPTRSSQ